MVTHRDLKAARLRLGESQETFAKRIGVHQTTLHGYESKRLPAFGPTRRVIEQLLKRLDREASRAS